MSNLTTFSKVLLGLAALTLSVMLIITCNNCTSGCANQNQQQAYQQPAVQDHGDYQVVQNPSGQVVVVKDNNGSEFFMNYLMFQTLMNSGGMGGVRGYYDQHRYDPDWGYQQSTYRSETKSVVNNYYGTSVDDSKPIGDQIKTEYKKSNGFGKPAAKQPESKPSNGFSGKWFESSEKSSTPPLSYKPSSGFGSPSSTSTNDAYKPSSGFGKSSTSKPADSYKPSSGFSKPSSSGSSYKSSSGFGKSSSTSRPSSSPSSKPSNGFGKKKN